MNKVFVTWGYTPVFAFLFHLHIEEVFVALADIGSVDIGEVFDVLVDIGSVDIAGVVVVDIDFVDKGAADISLDVVFSGFHMVAPDPPQ
ncbi:MAG: hypothetical protein ACXAD7_10300 [Candidatus Kariarchaeaceae archaeon]|jgi:hypothetical protein